ncbi:MAG: hypothetical protein ACI9BW_001929 [Gammaproteobacteria bacterium]|jgi:hypothetical protein
MPGRAGHLFGNRCSGYFGLELRYQAIYSDVVNNRLKATAVIAH